MVKFRARPMKKTYKKNKQYTYTRYSIDFPAKLNAKIEPHAGTIYDEAQVTLQETAKQEVLNIQLVRNKTQAKSKNKKAKAPKFPIR